MDELQEIIPEPRGINEPRYRENPIYLFFEEYILAVIGAIDEARIEEVQGMDLQTVFKTEATPWLAVVHEVMGLSDTIELAILDLWLRTTKKLKESGKIYHPVAFAQSFTDHYMADDSHVDQWTRDSLAAATALVGLKLDEARRITRGAP
ncbi:MAG: hypothetical protein ACI9QQ_002542 [Myxococcota bacterium]|jgi:hypothetical protein